MSKNTKHTSPHIARLASETLQDRSASQIARSLAGSALAQRDGDKQTAPDPIAARQQRPQFERHGYACGGQHRSEGPAADPGKAKRNGRQNQS